MTAVDKKDETWMAVRKQPALIRFYRDPAATEDSEVREALDYMKANGCVKTYLFSSAGFTTTAKRTAENRPIELIEKDRLEQILTKAGK